MVKVVTKAKKRPRLPAGGTPIETAAQLERKLDLKNLVAQIDKFGETEVILAPLAQTYKDNLAAKEQVKTLMIKYKLLVASGKTYEVNRTIEDMKVLDRAALEKVVGDLNKFMRDGTRNFLDVKKKGAKREE